MRSPNYDLILLMKAADDVGLTDPRVIAFVLDKDKKIRDSLEIHLTYHWNSSWNKRFVIDKELIISVTEDRAIDPNYGSPNLQDQGFLIKKLLIAAKQTGLIEEQGTPNKDF